MEQHKQPKSQFFQVYILNCWMEHLRLINPLENCIGDSCDYLQIHVKHCFSIWKHHYVAPTLIRGCLRWFHNKRLSAEPWHAVKSTHIFRVSNGWSAFMLTLTLTVYIWPLQNSLTVKAWSPKAPLSSSGGSPSSAPGPARTPRSATCTFSLVHLTRSLPPTHTHIHTHVTPVQMMRGITAAIQRFCSHFVVFSFKFTQ